MQSIPVPFSSNFPASLPPWHPDAELSELYDMTTVRGRLGYYFALTNPLELLVSNAEIEAAQQLLERARRPPPPPAPPAGRAARWLRWRARDAAREPRAAPRAADEAMWSALRTARIGAPLGEVVPPPFRTAGWATFGVVPVGWLTLAAVYAPLSLRAIAFGQWLNQTHLAGITWCNRTPDGAPPDGGGADEAAERERAQLGKLLRGYGAACCGAVPVAAGAAYAAKAVPALRFIAPYAPFPGVVTANFITTWCVRGHELDEGIAVSPRGAEPGAPPLGVSREAARAAMADTMLTRAAIPVGNFVFAPLLVLALGRSRIGRRLLDDAKAPMRSFASRFSITVGVFVVSLPAGLAVAPSTGVLRERDAEPRLRGRGDLVYSRGT